MKVFALISYKICIFNLNGLTLKFTVFRSCDAYFKFRFLVENPFVQQDL